MSRERVVFFLDYANINRAAGELGVNLDYAELMNYMGEGRFLVEAHVYVPIDPRNEHRLDATLERFWEQGYVVHRKVGVATADSYKCDLDVEITMDVLNTVYQVRPDIIVLGTGDGDFAPLVREVRRLGVRVEVASFLASTSKDLRLRSSGFVNLDDYVQEALQDLVAESGADSLAYPSVEEPADETEVQQNHEDEAQDDAPGPEPLDERDTTERAVARIPHADD